MKKLVLLMSFSLLFFTACKKKEEAPQLPDCVVNNYGYLILSNFNDEPYNIYIDGKYKLRQEAYDDDTLTFSPGTHSITAKEINYVLFQNVYQGAFKIEQCQETKMHY